MGQQETAIYQVLRKARADGTLSQTQDARALARFFLGVAWGINAVNKSVADSGVFRDMGQSRDECLGHCGCGSDRWATDDRASAPWRCPWFTEKEGRSSQKRSAQFQVA